MKKILIKNVIKNSIADELEIYPNDYLLSVNGEEIVDVLDYKYHMSDEFVTIEILHNDEIIEYEIEKEIYEDIGLVFENELIDEPKRCMNKCVFCFMDQLPDNMRKTLIFKDDDYRLSFLTGNYVTFSNCKNEDIDRIIKYRMSPINISVHTTNIELRKKMLNNKNADNVITYMQKLYDNEIFMNGQIVLCPGLNDKEELIKTVKDLAKFYPYMQSVSIVPVGLSKYRDKLYPLRPFTKEEMKQTIIDIEKVQKEFKKELGCNIVYLSDEFYLKSETELPNYDEYEQFPQLENGVGMVTLFLDEFNCAVNEAKKYNIKSNKEISLICGKLIKPYIQKCVDILTKEFGIRIHVYDIENDFFGENITVTGLLTGNDIYNQLKDKNLGEITYICDVMLKDDEDIFLDNMTVDQLSRKLKQKIIILHAGGDILVNELLK
ncbi:MAG: DUF512 domain-containing protein [Clostridiales bacterium]|nr:DUF512 domain-containing protein [Clostridiales bacterium]